MHTEDVLFHRKSRTRDRDHTIAMDPWGQCHRHSGQLRKQHALTGTCSSLLLAHELRKMGSRYGHKLYYKY